MTAKEFVKEKYPEARAVRRKGKAGTDEDIRWSVWSDKNQSTRLSFGRTESEAWVKAKKRILED